METVLAKLWTPGVQDGVVTWTICGVLLLVLLALREWIWAWTQRARSFLCTDVCVPRSMLFLAGLLAFNAVAAYQLGAYYSLGVACLSMLLCCWFVFRGSVAVTLTLPASVTHRFQPQNPELQFTEEDRAIFRMFMQQNSPTQRLTVADIAKRLGLSVHVVQHRIDVLFHERLLYDLLGHGLTARSFYLSEVGLATALQYQS